MSSTTLWIISDRKDLWNANALSEQTEMHHVDTEGSIKKESPTLDSLKDKHVLVVIHGYNTPKADVLATYFSVQSSLKRVGQIYDAIIGYLWPAGDAPLSYFAAEKHAKETSKRLGGLIDQIAEKAHHFDVMAHSLGNLLFLKAAKKSSTHKPLRAFFSLGAAVDDGSIEKKEIFGHAVQKCQQIYVIYSKKDEVLKYLYPLADHQQALGSAGAENPSRLSSNIQLVDSTDVVAAHSDYFKAPQIYRFIQNRLAGRFPLPHQRKNVKLLTSSTVVITTPSSSSWMPSAIKTALMAVVNFFSCNSS